MTWLIFGAVALLVVISAVVSSWMERKRRAELSAWAVGHNLGLETGRDPSFAQRYPGFDALRTGENRYAYNILSGLWSKRSFLGFDYHYETHSTDSKGRQQTHHHHFSAVIIAADVPLKPLHIRKENFFDHIADALGFDDINFESAEFSRTFRVKSPDRKWAYAVLHPRAMEFLMNGPIYTMDFAAQGVMARLNSRFTSDQFGEAADRVSGLLDLMPEYLVRELQEPAPPPLPS